MHAAKWTRTRRWVDRFAYQRGRHSLRATIGRHLMPAPRSPLSGFRLAMGAV